MKKTNCVTRFNVKMNASEELIPIAMLQKKIANACPATKAGHEMKLI